MIVAAPAGGPTAHNRPDAPVASVTFIIGTRQLLAVPEGNTDLTDPVTTRTLASVQVTPTSVSWARHSPSRPRRRQAPITWSSRTRSRHPHCAADRTTHTRRGWLGPGRGKAR
ncbi:hypothetical protein GCM10028802_29600 [Terrabacter terrigena]